MNPVKAWHRSKGISANRVVSDWFRCRAPPEKQFVNLFQTPKVSAGSLAAGLMVVFRDLRIWIEGTVFP